MVRNWTAEEHAKLLVAIIKTGNPKVDTSQIAAFLNNGRTACAVYFEIRRLKKLAEGGNTAVKKRVRRPSDFQQPSIDVTPVKAEPRPIRATKPSAAKRRFDEVADSGFWDESEEEHLKKPAKRAKGKVKWDDEFETNGSESASNGGTEVEA